MILSINFRAGEAYAGGGIISIGGGRWALDIKHAGIPIK